MNKKNNKDEHDLDAVNNERVETSTLRVAHAIKLLNNPVACLSEGRLLDDAVRDVAHAVNLLDAAHQDMQWACDHFEWNDDVCLQIEDACGKLGSTLAILTAKDDEDYELELAGSEGNDALSILGRVIATLIRWFDDEQDLSEV